MKNIPNKIYLQVGDLSDKEIFNELCDVSWSQDRIFNTDIEFQLGSNKEAQEI